MADPEVGFGEAYSAAGGVRQRAAVPYPLTHQRIREMADLRERLLRIQYDDERLPAEDEAALSKLSPADPDQCFRRYEYLIGLWGAWERGARQQAAGASDERRVASELVQGREPIRIRIAGHLIPVHYRSRAAIIRMARHEQARSAIGEKIDWLERRAQEIDARRNGGEMGAFAAWQERHRIAALIERAGREWEIQFRGVLANALSPDGRAALPEELPDILTVLLPAKSRDRLGNRAGEWWREITLDDERRIMLALFEHTSRYGLAMDRRELEQRQRSKSSSETSDEDTGFGIVLRMIEGKLGLPPMALEDEQLFPTIHAFMLGQPGTQAREIEDAFAA